MVWALIVGVSAAWGVECAERSTVASLQAAIQQAEGAYAQLDLPGFEGAVEGARAAVPCLEEVVPPSTVAALHRAEGLSAFVASDLDRSRRAFGAARRVQPSYRFPREMVPEDNPVLDAYAAFDVNTATTVTVASPASGTLRIDGQPTRERQADVPVLLQWLEVDGAVGLSAYLWPGDPLPAYPLPITQVEDDAPSTPKLRQRLLIGAGAGVLATGGLYAANVAVHQAYVDPQTPTPRLDGLRRTNNALVVASGVSLGLTLGAGGTALFVGPAPVAGPRGAGP